MEYLSHRRVLKERELKNITPLMLSELFFKHGYTIKWEKDNMICTWGSEKGTPELFGLEEYEISCGTISLINIYTHYPDGEVSDLKLRSRLWDMYIVSDDDCYDVDDFVFHDNAIVSVYEKVFIYDGFKYTVLQLFQPYNHDVAYELVLNIEKVIEHEINT